MPWLPGYKKSSRSAIGRRRFDPFPARWIWRSHESLHLARAADIQTRTRKHGKCSGKLKFLETHWRDPDEDPLEIRATAQTRHTRSLTWVAFDRAIKDAEKEKLHAPVARWRRLRDRIHAQVCKQGFDRANNTFVQSYESQVFRCEPAIDTASGFSPAGDPRVLGTIAAIEQHLLVKGLVRRYSTGTRVDALPAGEGAFLACSFWLADCYVLDGTPRRGGSAF